MNLRDLLRELPELEPDDPDSVGFIVRPILTKSQHRIGLDRSRLPVLLLHASGGDVDAAQRLPPVRLEHLSVQHDAPCRMRGPDGDVESGIFTILQFRGGPATLREHFLDVAQTLLVRLGPDPGRTDVHDAVQGMVDLFRALGRPARKSAQGLWAELLMLAVSPEPEFLARAWHAAPDERYDFHLSEQRLEVKSASGRTRRHRFTLAQLDPPAGSCVVIASVLMEQTSGGVALRELLGRCRERLSSAPEMLPKLEVVVVSTLGSSLVPSLDVAFDWQLAASSISFYRAEDVPSVATPLHPAVTDVSFVADLSSVPPAPPESLTKPLFQAAVPQHLTWTA